MFALSRTGFPLDNRVSTFVPDALEKKVTCVLDAFTDATTLLDKFLHGPLE
jgi:hypothetical protein